MLSLTHVGTFLAIVETGSFQEAARRLGTSQSTVSHGLKRLEETVGAQLLLRRREGCVPTRQGEIFLPFARSLVALGRRSLEQVRGDRVRIGASSNVGIYLLQPHLKRLADAGIAETDIVIGTNAEVTQRLGSREIDLAFLEWWDGRPGCEAVRWRTDRLVLIVPPGHPWAAVRSVDRERLFQERFLGGERGTGTGTLLRGALGDDISRLRMAGDLGSTEAVKRAVRAGLGVSLVMESAVLDEVSAGHLHTLAVEGLTLEKTLWAAWTADTLPTSPTARTRDFLLA